MFGNIKEEIRKNVRIQMDPNIIPDNVRNTTLGSLKVALEIF